MRPIGFSTGALAFGDFRAALRIMANTTANAVELSALREHELVPLADAVEDGVLELKRYRYVSIHAPSRLKQYSDDTVVGILEPLARRHWPIIVHPDTIRDDAPWKRLGETLCIENTDKRKAIGQTVADLQSVFRRFPQATFCLDMGHARQVDSTMTQAAMMLEAFRGRLRQLHVSEVNFESAHEPLQAATMFAFRKVADLIPEKTPIVLESVFPKPLGKTRLERLAESEIQTARNALNARHGAKAIEESLAGQFR